MEIVKIIHNSPQEMLVNPKRLDKLTSRKQAHVTLKFKQLIYMMFIQSMRVGF